MTPRLNSTTKVADPAGMPTIEILKIWAELARVVDDQQSQITALTAQITALTAQITALTARVAALEALHP